ncbi:class I adenylate-forming enzyme family protein [Streptacidiphilus sp. PAMC 29251]
MATAPFDAEDAAGYLDRVTDSSPFATAADTTPLRQTVESLLAMGLEQGSIVMIALPNSVRLVRTFFATVLAGYVPVLLPPSTPVSRAGLIADRLGAAALLRSRIPLQEHVHGRVLRVDDGEAVLFTGPGRRLHRPGQAVLLTSGTSGIATGCLHDIDALLRNARRHAASIGQTAADTLLVSLPVYYSFALVAQVLAAFVTGSRLVVTAPPYTTRSHHTAAVEHRATITSLTPFLLRTLLDGSGGELPPGTRMLTVGGHSVQPQAIRRLLELNPGLELYVTYGLTEAGPRVSTLAAHREPAHRLASVGRPLEGVSVGTREVGDGRRELIVVSDTVHLGRVGEEDATGRGGLVAPSVLATGDLGRVDADGYVHVQGRLSDFTEIHGEKVSLASVRRAAESLDGVLLAVPGVRRQDGREQVHVELFMRDLDPDTVTATEDSLRRQLRSLLTPGERPGALTLVPAVAGGFHK